MSWLSSSLRKWGEEQILRGSPLCDWNPWQESFCEWNAERLGISEEESRERFSRSWAAMAGGHQGRLFRTYGHLHMEVCRPFWGSTPRELWKAYEAHEPVQFLRLLSYGTPDLEAWPEFRMLEKRPDLTVLDFGCGLAQLSTTWALRMGKSGKQVRLFLADLPLLHLEFLDWLCRRWDLKATILECTLECPIPALPACDLCVATEILEHVHEPMAYLRAFAEAVKPGGLLLTNLEDHEEEFLHVSPDLGELRRFLATERWGILRANRLFQKPEA